MILTCPHPNPSDPQSRIRFLSHDTGNITDPTIRPSATWARWTVWSASSHMPGCSVELFINGSSRYSESQLALVYFLSGGALFQPIISSSKPCLFFYIMWCIFVPWYPSDTEILHTSGCFQNQCPEDPAGHFIPVCYFVFLYHCKCRYIILFWGVVTHLSTFQLTLVCVQRMGRGWWREKWWGGSKYEP